MQRVTNCVVVKDGKILLLQKPRRNWYVAPGGKMEPSETVREAVVREYREETGLYLKNPTLKGVFNFLIKEGDKIIDEWMMFTFFAKDYDGVNYEECHEGKLEWHAVEEFRELEMAPGDYHIIDYALNGTGILYGTFTYTPDYELLYYRLDPHA
ncbi:MAG: NUDIX hydrolase [Bacillaceae bacterium]